MRELEGFSPARSAPAVAVIAVLLALTGAALAGAAIGDTTLISRATGAGGVAAAGDSGEEIAISNSGRYIAFVSEATNLGLGAPAGVKSIYLRDTLNGTLELVSRSSAGVPAAADSTTPALSPGGRYVAFASTADNLSDEDNDSFSNVYLRDTATDTTTLISRASGATGAPGDGNSRNPAVSYGAQRVAFDSDARNLVPEANAVTNVYVRESATLETKLVSRTNPTFAAPEGEPADGGSSNGGSSNPSISFDAERVAFQSDATNLSTKDDDAVTDVFVRDFKTRSIFDVSCRSRVGLDRCPTPTGEPRVDGNSTEPSLSLDGGFVAFQSDATNIVLDADHPGTDVFLRGLSANTTTLVSRAYGAAGAPADGASFSPAVSGEGLGQFVAFPSVASNLGPEQAPGYINVFVRDVLNNTTAVASRANGATGAAAAGDSVPAAISGSGGFLAFSSDADNVSGEDNDGFINVFVRALDKTPPPPPIPLPEPPPGHCHAEPCPLEGGEHSGADHGAGGHTGTGHGGEHAGHDAEGPAQTLFAPSRQSVDRLYVMVQVHEQATVLVTATVNIPGSSRVYRFKSYKRKLPIHAVRRVKLKLKAKTLRTVKRALKRGRKLRVRVTTTAMDAEGNRGVVRDSIRLRP